MKRQGFTLIELLIVIAIIGLLSTLAVTALGGARTKARDARRLADVKQMQTALEMYYSDATDYPVGTNLIIGVPLVTSCLNRLNGFTTAALCLPTGTIYMGKVPTDPSAKAYTYNHIVGTNTYTLRYTLETTVQGIPAGIVTATEAGISL